MNAPQADLAAFQQALSQARSPDAAFDALRALTQATIGAKLFTVMTLDMEARLARRAYSSDPQHYPATGTKPIEPNGWFDIVHGAQRCFVANAIEEIAEVFPDHALIASLGCASVVNLPVVLGGEVVATINILHEAGYFTGSRVAAVVGKLSLPALAAVAVARAVRAV